MKSLAMLLLLAGCASPVQICLVAPIGRTDSGIQAVRMQCEIEK